MSPSSRDPHYRFPVKYQGIPDGLRKVVCVRDRWRCRWCGATNRGLDLHHVEYRRGSSFDREDNLICLCRQHHGFVHGTPAPNGDRIVKSVAQLILKELIEVPAATGLSLWRQKRRQWAREGRCEKHGELYQDCLECEAPPPGEHDGRMRAWKSQPPQAKGSARAD